MSLAQRHRLDERGLPNFDEGMLSVTNLDWITGMMGALAIAAVLWVAVAFA